MRARPAPLTAIAATLVMAATLTAAAAEDRPQRLLYLSAEQTEESRYGGAGWFRAPRGLDGSGPVYALEGGRSFPDTNRLGLMAGWRWLLGRVYVTALAGVEARKDGSAGAGSLDLWWDDGPWMASGRTQVMEGPDNGRAALGYRFGEGSPWFGPEISANWQGERLGLHATGLHLPWDFEARVSIGGTVRERSDHGGGFLELSLWRRF